MKNSITYFMPKDTVIPWLDIRLTEEEFNFLKNIISEFVPEQVLQRKDNHGAGNASRCNLVDKDNWFYKNVLKTHTEKMFYRSCINYYEEYIEKKTLLPEFAIEHLWGNFQHQTDHVPLHNHGGLYSFVVFMKIPTHWKEQHIGPTDDVPLGSAASDFAFVWPGEKNKPCITHNIFLSPEDEGRMLFFPAWLQHMVYPFYDCEGERITISGNINIKRIESGKYVDEIHSGSLHPAHVKTSSTVSTQDPEEIKKLMRQFGKR